MDPEALQRPTTLREEREHGKFGKDWERITKCRSPSSSNDFHQALGASKDFATACCAGSLEACNIVFNP